MNISVTLDKRTPFAPGELISGKVIYLKTSDFGLSKVQGILIKFRGQAVAKFTKISSGSETTENRNHLKCFTAQEPYFDYSEYLIGDGNYEVRELSALGRKEIPFSYMLPVGLPSSFKGSHGSVEYTISVVLKRSWAATKEIIVPFLIQGVVDICQIPWAQKPFVTRKRQKIGLFWWSGAVSLQLNLRKQSYLAGEHIILCIEGTNQSRVKTKKLRLHLIQECKYMAEGGSHTVVNIIAKGKGPVLYPNDHAIMWNSGNCLQIPSVPPTQLGGCSIIQTHYFLHIIAKPSIIGMRERSMSCRLPILIGTTKTRPNSVMEVFSPMNTEIYRRSWCPSRGASLPSSPVHFNPYENIAFPLTRSLCSPVTSDYENFHFNIQPSGLSATKSRMDTPTSHYERPPTYEEALKALEDNELDVATETIYANSDPLTST